MEQSNILGLFSQSSSDFLRPGEFLLKELLNVQVEGGVNRPGGMIVVPGHGSSTT